MVKELQGKDYEKLGLNRGVLATLSGDDLKMAKSVQENAKKEGRAIEIYRNGLGEIGLQENGKDLGLINEEGISRQDLANLVRDPTNYVPVPAVGAALKLGKIAATKALAKLAGATAATDLAVNTGANLENKDKVIQGKDLTGAATAGVSAPVFSLGAGLLGKGLAKTVSTLSPKVSKKVLKEGEEFLTPGQTSGSKLDLDYEESVKRGKKGEQARAMYMEVLDQKKQAYKDYLGKKYGIDTEDLGKSTNQSNLIIADLGSIRKAQKESIDNLYKDLNPKMADFGFKKEQVNDLVGRLKKNLQDRQLKSWNEIEEDMVKGGSLEDSYKYTFNAIKGIEDRLNKNKEFIGYNDIEGVRRSLNDLIEKANTKGRKTDFGGLVEAKKTIDNFEDEALANNAMYGNSEDLANLKIARANKADYEQKFTNTKKDNLFEENSINDRGAKRFRDLLENNDISGDELVKTMQGSDATAQVELINKIQEVTGNKYNDYLKQIYLQKFFTKNDDINLGGFEGQGAVKAIKEAFEKYPKVAEKLFSLSERQAILKEANLIKKMQRSNKSSNPSGTAFELPQQVLNSLPLTGLLKSSVDNVLGGFKDAYRTQKLKQYLANLQKKDRDFTEGKLSEGIARATNNNKED